MVIKASGGLLALLLLLAACGSLPTSTPTAPAIAPTAQAALPARVARASQDNDIRFERISVERGLSQSSVICIQQDGAGFLWLGTEDGLNRYDGYNFGVYRHDPQDPHSLGNSTVRSMLVDRRGMLWVGTDGGLNRYDPETDAFARYQADDDDPHSLSHNTVWSIYEDRAGVLWVGTNAGLDSLDRESGTFTHHRPERLGPNVVWSIQRDLSGLLWLGTSDGLVAYDPEGGTLTRYRNDPLDASSLSQNIVRAVYVDQAGTLWAGTESGLNQFNRESGAFTRYRNDSRNAQSLSHNAIRAIYQDHQGTLWIATANGGLDKLDRERGNFVHYRHDPGDASSLSSNDTLTVFEDREGVLWVGTSGGGVNKSDFGGRQFAHYKHIPGDHNSLSGNVVRAVLESRDGSLWVGTTAGLDRIDRQTGRVAHYYSGPAPYGLSDDFVLSVYEDQEGILWIGTLQGGLNRMDQSAGDIQHYRNSPRDPLSLSNNTARVIYEDRAGTLWIGTTTGLNAFDRESGVFARYTPGMAFSLRGSDVRAIHEDRRGLLWIGTAEGLYRFDRESEQTAIYRHDAANPASLSDDFVLSIAEDRDGNLWIGTFQGGLNRMDRETGQFTAYRGKDGLANDVVYGILEDGAGNLWLSTNLGLSRFDPRTETFQNFDVRDGLQSNEFNGGAYHQSASGEMFFGGVNGFNAFYPEEIQENAYVPPVVLTSLTQSGGDVVVGQALERVTEIQLAWPNNFFEFEFAALSYAQPEKNQYAYMLEGFDAEWNDVGARRFGKYTNLPGKTYTLRIKGSNNDGVWNDEGASVRIHVTPPFWATWWFRGLALLLVVGGVIGGYRLRVRGIEARSRELERLVEQRTAELQQEIEQRTRAEEALRQSELEQAIADERSRLARELHDAVSQTLFSASLVAEALPSTWERDREEGEQLLQELRQSTRGVLAEMRTLLLELRPTALLEASLDDLLRQLAEATAGREDLPITVTVEDHCNLPADVHIALYRIAQEALNNVAKHARASQVTVELRCTPSPTETETAVELRIHDDGRGFDPDTVPPGRLGLGIMRERAEAVGATLAIQTGPGQGTAIRATWQPAEG